MNNCLYNCLNRVYLVNDLLGYSLVTSRLRYMATVSLEIETIIVRLHVQDTDNILRCEVCPGLPRLSY